MNFSQNTPTVKEVIRIEANSLMFEAEVIGRDLAIDGVDDEITLSNGAIARLNRESKQWRVWRNGDVGESKAVEVNRIINV